MYSNRVVLSSHSGLCCRHRDADRSSFGKHRTMTSSSSTYALAPVYCADSQQTTTTDTSALTIVPQSPSKARTLPPRVGSPSPRTCRRLQIVGYSPTTMRQHKFVVDGGVDAMTTSRFNERDVWKTTRDRDDLSVLPAQPLWTDTDLPPPPPPTTTTWQRCSCTAGPPPGRASPGRVRRTLPTSPTSFSTFKPSPATSPAGVETSCPMRLRPERCVDPEQTTTTRPQQGQGCHAMSLHLHVKHGVQCPDNANRSEQSTA